MTPETIQEFLSRCEGTKTEKCAACTYRIRCNFEEYALAYIQLLERERDAILKDLKEADRIECDHCKHYAYCQDCCEAVEFDCKKCDAECKCKDCINNINWEWRGIQEDENGSNTAENEH